MFGKITMSEKHYSVDKQYSWFTKKNAYSIVEAFISFNDGCRSGTIYIYDEIEKEILCSYDLRCIHMQLEKCGFYKHTDAFGGTDTDLGLCELPRPINYK